MLNGGDGNDFVDGHQGADVASLGAGDDAFQWDAGDGSDTVDGQAGDDLLAFNGANVAEKFVISANGTRSRFTRDVGNITMDLNSIERVDANALGATDTVTVNDLTGSGVSDVALDLAATPGGTTGDGVGDNVIVNATDQADNVKITGSVDDGVTVSGLAALVQVRGTDLLAFNALAGNDIVNATGLDDGVLVLTVDGGHRQQRGDPVGPGPPDPGRRRWGCGGPGQVPSTRIGCPAR